MIVRLATPQDFEPMIEMGARMHAAGKYAFLPYDKAKLLALAKGLHDSPNGILIVAAEDNRLIGMIVGFVEEFYFCRQKLARDLLVWVEESERGSKAGTYLISAFEEWAKSRGAVETCLCDTNGGDSERIGALYRRIGYERVGGIYKRRIG